MEFEHHDSFLEHSLGLKDQWFAKKEVRIVIHGDEYHYSFLINNLGLEWQVAEEVTWR